MKAHEWLHILYDRNEIYEQGLLEIYDVMDSLLTGGRFKEVDAILGMVEIDKLNATSMLAFLTITGAYRDQLNEYPAYFRKVEERIRKELPEHCESIMRGLSPRHREKT